MTASGHSTRRILYVQRTGGGGSVVSLLLLVKALDRERFKASVLFCEPTEYGADFETAGADVLSLDPTGSVRSVSRFVPGGRRAKSERRGLYRAAFMLNRHVQRDWPMARKIAQVVRKLRADLVHSNVSPATDRASILGAAIAGVRQVSHVRFMLGHTRLLDLPLSQFVEHYVYVSEAVGRQFRSDVGIQPTRGSVIYDPFEFPDSPSRETINHVRRSLGVVDSDRLVANVGRIVPWKGQDVFLRAFARIVRDHPEAKAVVVGGVKETTEAREFEAHLDRLHGELRLGDRVIFTGHRPDVEEIMAASALVVHSSTEPEPLGRVVMEAIALETPVIGTSAGGVPEMISPGETGTLVPLGDVGAMAEAISRVLADPSRAATIARRARAASMHRFGMARHARAIEGLYERVLGLR